MSIPGVAPLGGLFGRSSNSPAAPGGGMSEQQMMMFMQNATETCPFKVVMAGTMGFALGGMFGLFMSSMRYDTPMSSATSTVATLSVREQLRSGLKDMGRASFSSAKNFGMVGAIFSGTECCIEGLRAKNDLTNGVAAGCMTGGILAAKAGPQAAAVGCAGFAAFSAAIDMYMRQPAEPLGGRVD